MVQELENQSVEVWGCYLNFFILNYLQMVGSNLYFNCIVALNRILFFWIVNTQAAPASISESVWQLMIFSLCDYHQNWLEFLADVGNNIDIFISSLKLLCRFIDINFILLFKYFNTNFSVLK